MSKEAVRERYSLEAVEAACARKLCESNMLLQATHARKLCEFVLTKSVP